jgi:hypothetical protein
MDVKYMPLFNKKRASIEIQPALNPISYEKPNARIYNCQAKIIKHKEVLFCGNTCT